MELLFLDELVVKEYYIHPFHLNPFPDVFRNIRLLGQISVQFFPALEIHNKYGTFHLAFFVKQASGT